MSNSLNTVMKTKSIVLIALSSLLLLGVFFKPLWYIELEAPQYPEGIVMYIHVNKIDGADPNTIANVNILNHYIGMKYIVPESIPELTYFPYVIIGLVVTGLLAAFSRKKGLIYGWIILLTLLSAVGIFDFYLWEYDYGHNLDPEAPIIVEGMTYQPPLFGTKWLLNFKATSYPHIGGIMMGISVLFANLVWLIERKKAK